MSEYLSLSCLCNRTGVQVIDQPQLVYMLIELLPGDVLAETSLPLNFALLLDHSGSMAGEKLRTMKEAVKNIIDQLGSDDILSIITFESKTHVIVPAQPVANKADLKRQVELIKDAGGTNMAPGLREALKQVSQMQTESRINRIVLLTDGEATDKEDDSRWMADEAGERGIPITALGFGRDWNEDFLFDLADRSMLAEPGSRRGKADYIPTPKEANKIFQEVYQSMQVVADNVSLTLRMVQGLEARRVWQVTPLIRDLGRGVIQGRAMVVPIGELEKSGAAYLAEIMLPPRPAGVVRIAQAEVTYNAPGQGLQREAADVILNFSSDAAVYSPLNGRVMNVVEKVQAFKLQTQALDDAQAGEVGSATRKLRQAVTILLSQGETDLAVQMQQEADRLEQTGQISSEGKKTIILTSRKTVRLSDMT
jgi:Ca-activated chloride channel family protein